MGVFRKVELLKDYTRTETFQDESEGRKIVISIYYPDTEGVLNKNASAMKYMELFGPCEQQVRASTRYWHEHGNHKYIIYLNQRSDLSKQIQTLLSSHHLLTCIRFR